MKRLGNVLKAALLLAVMLFLVGCGYSEEDKALMKSYEENAKVNAVDYIEAKYGFTADVVKTKVLKVDSGPVPSIFPAPNGYVNVTMKYNGKEFLVKINGEEYTNVGLDDYQKEEICEAFKDRLEKDLSIKIEDINLLYMTDCLIEKKFTDFDSFLLEGDKRNPVSVSIKTLDDVSEDTLKDILSTELEILIISCDNQSDVEALKNIDYINKFKYQDNFSNPEYLDNKLFDYSIYMKGYTFKRFYDEPTTRLYGKSEAEDGVIVVFDKDATGSGVNVAVTKDMAPAWDWSKDSGKAKSLPTFINPKKVSKDYAVDFGDSDKVQVYISKDKTDSKGNEQRYIAMQYIDENGNEIFDHIAPTKLNDYYSFNLKKQRDMKVVVMINEK